METGSMETGSLKPVPTIKNSPAVRTTGLFGFRMNVYGQSFFTGPKMSSLYASMYSTQKKSSPIRASVA